MLLDCPLISSSLVPLLFVRLNKHEPRAEGRSNAAVGKSGSWEEFDLEASFHLYRFPRTCVECVY